MKPYLWMVLPLVFVPTGEARAADADPAQALYQTHCASCHGGDRLGGVGAALLPENLGRLKRRDALKVVINGRAATRMPAFIEKLSQPQAEALVEYIYRPPAQPPRWGLGEIFDSQVIHHELSALASEPVFKADPLNVFVVVETGDHHATLLDGDTFKPIHRFPTRYALHGKPKFSPDGRFVYFASRDGWITKYDIYNLKPVAEVRAGINTRNIAVSSDGRYVMVANYLPHSLVVLDADVLMPLKVIPVKGEQGKTSRVSAVYDVPPRRSFIVALKDLTEVWEIPYGEPVEPVHPGSAHYDRMGEAHAEMEAFPIRRIRLDDYLDDFFFDPGYAHLIGSARNGQNGQVINLVVGRKIADVPLPRLPHLSSGVAWEYEGGPVLATPNLKAAVVSVIDMRTWKMIERIDTKGPGLSMRSHENTPYAWVDVFFGRHKDLLHVIDKKTLKIVKTLRPAPGKTAAHVAFTRDGRYALVSVRERKGALVVYDAKTLEEVTRIPMNKPSGKYNVYNNISQPEGPSH